MRTETYSKSEPLSTRLKAGPLAGGGVEIAVLGVALAGGIGIGIALDSLALGFAGLIVLALIVRLVLAIVGMDGGSAKRTHEQA